MNASPFFLALLRRLTPADAQCRSGFCILRYSLGVRVTTVVLAALFAPSLARLLIYPRFESAFMSIDFMLIDRVGGTYEMLFALAFCMVFVYLLVTVLSYRVAYDDKKVSIFTGWGPTKRIPWTDIKTFARDNDGLCFTTSSHGCICINFLVEGISSFENMLFRHATFYPNASDHHKKC